MFDDYIIEYKYVKTFNDHNSKARQTTRIAGAKIWDVAIWVTEALLVYVVVELALLSLPASTELNAFARFFFCCANESLVEVADAEDLVVVITLVDVLDGMEDELELVGAVLLTATKVP